MEKVIEIKNLTKSYKNLKAVDDLSFDVYKGEILGLLGPNGSGKSTTINSILSLLKYESGTIKIFNKEMKPDSYDLKRDIGVIFQEVAVFNELTVLENIDYFCGLYITDKNKRNKCVEDAIKLVGLENYKKFYPKQLSGGLLRRLNIACGIAHKPKLIFLDEPTVAVDPQSRNNILDGIKMLRDKGATIVYTTHYMEEAEILCDRIIILDKGKIIAEGTKEQLKEMTKIEEKITLEIDSLNEEIINENSDEVLVGYHIKPNEDYEFKGLKKDQKKIVDEVLKKFENYTTKNIVEYMHEEKAYKDTKYNEIIDYSYSKFIKI